MSATSEPVPAETHPEQLEAIRVLEKFSLSSPANIPNGLTFDWIDAIRNISVQVMRLTDRKFYDFTTVSFKAEADCTNRGLLPFNRDSGLRANYQWVDLTTPVAVFTDGAYGVYFYDETPTLLETTGFHIYGGIPFEGYSFPYFNLIPSANDIAVAMVVKLLDNTTVSLHKKPDTPGLAFFKALNPPLPDKLTVSGLTSTRVNSPMGLTVTAADNLGATFPIYGGTVHFTSSDQLAVLPPDYTFTAADAGKHVFITTAFKTAGIQTLTITDTAHNTIKGTIIISVSL